MPLHANATGTDLHEAKRRKEPVHAASTANVTLATPGASIDGVSLSSGDRVLLKNQSSPAENGIYVWTGAATPLTRALDADSASDFTQGFDVYVREGTVNAATYWVFTQTSSITLNTTALSFASMVSGSTLFSDAEGNPANLAGTSSDGTSGYTARRDHVHQGFNDSEGDPANLTGSTAADGTSTYAARRDHAHKGFLDSEGDPADVTGSAAADGTSAYTARRDHAHKLGVITTQGDVIVGGVSGVPQRLGSGANGTVLTSTGAGNSLTWTTVTGGSGGGGGGSGALVPITVVGPLTAAAASITFSNIPQGFRNLVVQHQLRGAFAATSVATTMTFNGDGSSNYDYELYTIAGSTPTIVGGNGSGVTSYYLGDIPGASAPGGSASNGTIRINNYSSTTLRKQARSELSSLKLVDSSSNLLAAGSVGEWRSTAAITTITINVAGNLDVGSYACLYGEMDSAGVLLTPASNLLYETTLTASQTSIDTGTLSTAYRDLVVYFSARTDASAGNDAMMVRVNGDTGANYDKIIDDSGGATATTAQTSIQVSYVPRTADTANTFGTGTFTIPDYANTTRFKDVVERGRQQQLNRSSYHSGTWKNTSAVTSLQFFPSTGPNLVAGTTIRIYGEPVSAGGTSVGTGTRLRLSGNQSTTTGTATAIAWDTEDNDADNQHFNSAAALSSGTVTKTAGSQTVTGSSTVFLSDLSVGQVISVTGTATEKRVVIAIASNTSLTVNAPFVNTQAGATCTRVNSAVVFRQSGFYTLEANIYSAALSTGAVTLQYYLNSLTTATSGTAIGQRDPVAINASAGYDLVVTRNFQIWDFVEVVWTQNAGTVNVLADERTHLAVNARPTVTAAVPYICIRDEKAQNTAGGTFTSGADRTRDLTTVGSDTAGLTTLSGNQFTLPNGTYRYSVSAPGYQCGAHQAFLYNITDSVEVKRGSAESSGTSSATTTSSVIRHKMVVVGTKTFEVRHRCATTSSTNGFGLPANFGTEVYTVAEFWKEA